MFVNKQLMSGSGSQTEGSEAPVSIFSFPNQFVSCDIFCFCDAILVEHRSWIIHDFFIKTPPFA